MNCDTKIPRWKKRVSICEAIYSDLVISDKERYLSQIQHLNGDQWGAFEKKIYHKYLKKKEIYLTQINELLRKDWEVQRLNLSTLAILLEAVTEYEVFKTNPSILIHQSIITSKKYGETEHKLVHAIINNYLSKLKSTKID